jgi:hypothetical protein
MCLGPAIPATCTACGRKIGVSYWSMWTVAPFLIAIMLATFVHGLPEKILIWAAGFLVMSFCHLKFIPLVKR